MNARALLFVTVKSFFDGAIRYFLWPKNASVPMTAYLQDRASLVEAFRLHASVYEEIQDLTGQLSTLEIKLAHAQQKLDAIEMVFNIF